MSSDALLHASPTQALALSIAHQEDALALFEEGGPKRRRTGTSIPKKGKRWGMMEDKPFKPLPYVDLPVGLDDNEIDQFLREQRLEDLHKKIQVSQLEDVEPDLRPPSPPPLYDKAGMRLNSREIRIKKAMLAEYNRLIRYMIKTIDGYTPPPDWKPQRLVKKVLLPLEKYPTAPFMGIIIGARGVNHKRLQETTGCKIFIRGKDVGDKYQSDEELVMPQHVHIEGDTEEQIEAAEKLIAPLLNPESPEFEYARTHGMQQLATVNGFTINKQELRCSVCMALGHLAFDCPEAQDMNYKMANVVCAICGDRGHVAKDCKQAMEQHQRENIDWKEEAEKKHTLDAAYRKMMSELGENIDGNAPPERRPETVPLMPKQPPDLAPAPLRPGLGLLRPSNPLPERPAAGPLGVLPAVPPEESTALAPRPQGLVVPPPSTTVTNSAPMTVPPRPWRPASWQAHAPLQPRLRPNVPFKMPPPSPATGSFGSRPPWAAAPRIAAPGNNSSQSFATSSRHDVDGSILCPHALVALVGTVLSQMSHETGARISLDAVHPEPGGQRVLIQGSQEAQERAKMHFRAWLSVQTGSQGPGPPDFLPEGFPPDGFPLGMSFPPDGFPPSGVPPPINSPPNGFPPGMAPPPFLNGHQPAQVGETLEDVFAPPGMPMGFGVSWDEL